MKQLDLHGVIYDDVPLRCHRFINENWGDPMKIITGHSRIMTNLVTRIIKQYDLGYHIGGITGTEGYIRIF